MDEGPTHQNFFCGKMETCPTSKKKLQGAICVLVLSSTICTICSFQNI